MCRIQEKNMDLFDLPHGYAFAHCVSADFAMGAGIAAEFEEYYHMRDWLRSSYREETDPEGLPPVGVYPYLNVYNLVTKRRYYNKPTYADLRTALQELHDFCAVEDINRLGMPRIGCGLDRLDWDVVRPMIEEIFEDLDIDIVICYL